MQKKAIHTVSGVDFESMQAFHVTPHHHHVAARVFIHSLNDLKVQVSVVEVVLVDCKSPWFGKATYHSHSCCPIHCTTLNLSKTEDRGHLLIMNNVFVLPAILKH